MDCLLAALDAVGDVVRDDGEGSVAWDMDCGRVKGAALIGVAGEAPR